MFQVLKTKTDKTDVCVVLIALMFVLFSTYPAIAQTDKDWQEKNSAIISEAIEQLLQMQEGEDNAEWPYEGVYRVRDQKTKQSIIPIGYRIGGSAITAMTLSLVPGYEEDEERTQAVERATKFIVEGIKHPLMSMKNINSSYDVRGWGYTYGLTFLLHLKKNNLGPNSLRKEIEEAITFYIKGIETTEIPQSGGWNYARGGGFDKPGPMSPFMTAPTLMALFEAEKQGYPVNREVVARGLDALEKAKLSSGAYVYSGTAESKNMRSKVPGAVGRMSAAETALYLGGRSTIAEVRGAIDAFFVHWEWLDKRRAQNGTHIPPYGIAPYYFYFAHYYAAQAIELLPEQDRAEYRRKLRELIYSRRLDNNTWNDRVFKRTANYSTAMCTMALMMKDIELPPQWEE